MIRKTATASGGGRDGIRRGHHAEKSGEARGEMEENADGGDPGNGGDKVSVGLGENIVRAVTGEPVKSNRHGGIEDRGDNFVGLATVKNDSTVVVAFSDESREDEREGAVKGVPDRRRRHHKKLADGAGGGGVSGNGGGGPSDGHLSVVLPASDPAESLPSSVVGGGADAVKNQRAMEMPDVTHQRRPLTCVNSGGKPKKATRKRRGEDTAHESSQSKEPSVKQEINKKSKPVRHRHNGQRRT